MLVFWSHISEMGEQLILMADDVPGLLILEDVLAQSAVNRIEL